MVDCTLPQNWNLPGCAQRLPIMDTAARPSATGGGSSAPAAPNTSATALLPVAANAAPASTSSSFPWGLLAAGLSLYVVLRPSKGGMGHVDDNDPAHAALPALSGPRRRKPRPAAKSHSPGQHVSRLVIN